MPKCSVRSCKNNTLRKLKKDGISYFRFPRDPIRCGEWTSIVSQVRREACFKPNNSTVVCSEHFLEEDMYVSSKGIKRLRKTAVPNVVAQDKGKPDKKESEVPPSHDFYDTVSDYKTESDDTDSEQAPQQYQVDVQGSWRAASPERRSASSASTAAGPSASHPASPAASHPSSPAASPPSSPAASPPASPTVGTPACRRKRARTSHHADTNEFYAFSQSIAAQLSSMPLKDAIQLQLEIQQLISKKRLSRLQQDMATQTQAADPLYLLVKAEPTEAMNNACQ